MTEEQPAPNPNLPTTQVKCDQTPLAHSIMELISDLDFDGYLLTHFDCTIVKQIEGLPKEIQTAALMYSNGRYFFKVCEEFFKELSNEERVAVMKHEVAHFIMKHITRRNGRDPMVFNVAADMAINQNITGLPKDCVKLLQGT